MYINDTKNRASKSNDQLFTLKATKGKHTPEPVKVSPQMQEDPLSFSLPHLDRVLFRSQTDPTQHSTADMQTKEWKDNEDPSSSQSLTTREKKNATLT